MSTLQNQEWAKYEFQPSFILGFHGCDKTVGEAVLRGETGLIPFPKKYDWLGTGVYFWEGNVARALKFAEQRKAGGLNSIGDIKDPFVIGAVINLGRCLDLADDSAITQVKDTYKEIKRMTAPSDMRRNSKTLGARFLDCYVIDTLNKTRADDADETIKEFDTVRGLFWEGKAIYPRAGIREYNHIQICVRNLDCILGYFRPMKS